VIVAVVAVRVVQVSLHQVIRVIAVRHRFMAALLPVAVLPVVLAAIVAGLAIVRVLRGNRHAVVVDMAGVRVMQMPVVEVVRVAFVTDGRMAAVGPVLMPMPLVGMMLGPRLSRHRLTSAGVRNKQ
jgi:hypothetical protein